MQNEIITFPDHFIYLLNELGRGNCISVLSVYDINKKKKKEKKE